VPPDPRDAVRVAWAVVPEGTARREVAWDLVRALLPGARLSNPCPRCGGAHGPLRVEGVAAVASAGYAGGYAVVAVAPRSAASGIGVDVEVDAPRATAGLDRVLAPGASVRAWVRVEAALKADGRGLRVDPAAVRVEAGANGWTARIDGGAALCGRDVPGPPATLVSIAVRSARPE
jgi:4'-phosphopantetheinyl transferase